MFLKHEAIDVRVSERILWIGSEAYPLHNIARASTSKLVPRRGAAVWKYVKFIVILAVLGAVLSMVFGSSTLSILITVTVLVLIAIRTIRLVAFLNMTLHELIIETSGASRRGVVSDDETVVSELVVRVTNAINNPHAEFQMRVETLHVGDNVNMFGDQNVGKVVR